MKNKNVNENDNELMQFVANRKEEIKNCIKKLEHEHHIGNIYTRDYIPKINVLEVKLELIQQVENAGKEVQKKQTVETLPFNKARKHQILEEVDHDYNKQLKDGSSWEMTSLIYDTLFNNIDYPQLDIKLVGETECDLKNRHISFEYMGHQYGLSVFQE